MFKTASRPLPDLKDWRFSVDEWGIAWAEFDREGENQNSLGRRPLEELGEIVAVVEKGARDKTIRGLVIISAKERGFIVGADIREFADLKTESEVIEKLRAVTALFDRFSGLFQIRPVHNPLRPFDFAGTYDPRSDRLQSLSELADRGYEDAYRQFIEPIVGAPGDERWEESASRDDHVARSH